MATRNVSIRMYRQGLGDCFLLTFPRDPEPFHMLVDCGALKSKHYDANDMRRIVGEIRAFTGDRLDVLAATHEHWDHISGFADAKAEFDQIDVDAVWVAWTENPRSKAAQLLKRELGKGKDAVENALARMTGAPGSAVAKYKDAVAALLEFSGGLGAAATTASAWQYVLGKAPKVYCDPRKAPMELDGVEDVRIFVLGPPEELAYAKRLLSKSETYDEGHPAFAPFAGFVAAAGAAEPSAVEQAFPFGERYRLPSAKAKTNTFFARRYYGPGDEWRHIDRDWMSLAGELALHLDSYTNNTCLAFAVELGSGGPVLLFPGDAQVGNWLSWQERKWTVRESGGKTREVTSNDLLSRTVLYKVGHHGSHNATMRAKGLELMESPDLVAMIPVHRPTAQDQEWAFPYPALLTRLIEKARGRVLLADAADINEIQSDLAAALTPKELVQFTNATTYDPSFIEFRITY